MLIQGFTTGRLTTKIGEKLVSYLTREAGNHLNMRKDTRIITTVAWRVVRERGERESPMSNRLCEVVQAAPPFTRWREPENRNSREEFPATFQSIAGLNFLVLALNPRAGHPKVLLRSQQAQHGRNDRGGSQCADRRPEGRARPALKDWLCGSHPEANHCGHSHKRNRTHPLIHTFDARCHGENLRRRPEEYHAAKAPPRGCGGPGIGLGDLRLAKLAVAGIGLSGPRRKW